MVKCQHRDKLNQIYYDLVLFGKRLRVMCCRAMPIGGSSCVYAALTERGPICERKYLRRKYRKLYVDGIVKPFGILPSANCVCVGYVEL